ncbi:MAG: response regulator [bacterium]|nr:response regulator [bacterium]
MANIKTVLCIEDEPHLQEELTAALVEEGFTVKNAYDGEAGLALAKKEIPDMILLDLILPKKDGFEVLEALKKDAATKSIPVIVLSNLETAENVEKAIRLGAASYLVKPNYEISHITQKVKNVLGNS